MYKIEIMMIIYFFILKKSICIQFIIFPIYVLQSGEFTDFFSHSWCYTEYFAFLWLD